MADKPIGILIVVESTGHMNYLEKILGKSRGEPFELETSKTLSGALEHLNNGGIDAVITDFSLPDSKGIDTFLKLHSRFHKTPVIVMTTLAGRIGGQQGGARIHLKTRYRRKKHREHSQIRCCKKSL